MSAHRGELTISLSAVAQNYSILNEMTAESCIVAPAVKADAYGLGIERVSSALHKAGAKKFFVATLEEGVQLRETLPDAAIYILNGFAQTTREE